MKDLTVPKLTALLQAAERAHHDYEAEIGRVDLAWPVYYARFIVDALEAEEGPECPLPVCK